LQHNRNEVNQIVLEMKKLLFSLLMVMMTLSSMAQGGKFTVQGWFLCEGNSLKLQIVDCDCQLLYEETRAASADMLEFSFDLKDAAKLIVDDGREGYQRHYTVPAIPGDTVIFYMEADPYYCLGGSQFYIDYDEAVQAIEPQAIELFEVDAHSDRYLEVLEKYQDALLSYVENHPDQEASAALLGLFAEDETLEIGHYALLEQVNNSVAANLYKSKLPAARERLRMMPMKPQP